MVAIPIAILALAFYGCGGKPSIEIAAGVSWELAEQRAATISDLRYDVRFSIPSRRTAPISGHILAHFVLAADGPAIFDFAQPPDHVHEVRVGGAERSYEVRDEHIIVPGLTAGEVTVELDFTTGDGSLNRQEDFLYTLFVPDRARVAFPLFDQPNLKARYSLQLELPVDWVAVANGSLTSREVTGDRAVITFAETELLSSYLFSFAAGRFTVEHGERDGRVMTMYHRETERELVERNVDEIFDLHATSLSWLEEYTGIRYPFEKFDFVAVPSFQYGGMEHPGAVLYRAEGLFLDESATQNSRLGRASLIAHETAHHWFGDLVTMEWFTDVWMKETFANFMAAKIVNPTFPDVDHELRFLLAHYPAAYSVDRTGGTNSIRQPLENLNQAGTLYGPIIYQKAPIVVQHLEQLMGEAQLRIGLQSYLSKYAYDNADWGDLISILDGLTAEDLTEWSQLWVNESGRPEIAVALETDGEAITGLDLRQADETTGGSRVWNQRLSVLLGYRDGDRILVPVHLRDAAVAVSGAIGQRAPDFVLPNGEGVGYGRMVLDQVTERFLLESLPTVESPMTRAIAWVSLWDAVLEGEVEADVFIDLAQRALPLETDEQNVSLVLGYLRSAYWRFLSPAQREVLGGGLESLLWQQTEAATQRSTAAVFFRAYRDIAETDGAVARLSRIWQTDESVPGVPLSERDLTTLALELAVRGADGSEAILQEQRDRIGNPDRRAEFDFVIPALAHDPAVRESFFAALANPANRERETWVLRGLRYLHHPLRARDAERFIRPSLDMLEDIQRTGDIFFPDRWLGATLGGHQTTGAAAIVDAYLNERVDVPPRLRAKVLQAADGLRRASQIAWAAPVDR